MKFFNQIGHEIKNIYRSKFILIIGILILLASIASPIITVISQKARENQQYPGGPIIYEKAVIARAAGMPYYPGEEPITIDGVTITSENPFYWNVRSIQEEKTRFETDTNIMSSPQALDLLLEFMDAELTYYVRAAAQILTYEDYRMDLIWSGTTQLYDQFIHSHYDPDSLDALKEAIGYRYGIDPNTFDDKYVNITSEERLRAIDEASEYLDTIFTVIESNDFPMYVDLRIMQERKNIENLEEQIEAQEQLIIDNPSQEESINEYIEQLRRNIEMIETNTIPILQYRLEKNIIPGTDAWQNRALTDIENSRNQLMWTEILTEEEFSRDQWLAQQYGTYAKYVAAMQKQIDKLNNTILIAEKCLDVEKPDMKYVTNGARNITVNFLGYSTFVALFGVLLGGWLIASEFQQGTIRLLMIRPRTRTKILMSKFIAALIICLGIYTAGSLLNLITNGICFGFADFMYPNFNVGGEINFFVYYLPKFLACMAPIVFGFCAAFMLSVLIRNIAVSIAIPIFCFIGSIIAMQMLAYRQGFDWIAWTPMPYVQIAPFFAQYSFISNMVERGVPVNLYYGIALLLGLSAVCVTVAILVFKKRDITN